MERLENDPEARAGWVRARARIHVFAKVLKVLGDLPEYREAEEARRRAMQEFWDAFRTESESQRNLLATRHLGCPKTLEEWEHLARVIEMPDERLRTGDYTIGEVYEYALAWADRQEIKGKLAALAKTNAEGAQPEKPAVSFPKKAKRSTERGESQAKLIAALTKHHRYADGGCLNLEPIGNNELARVVGVSPSTASTFFNSEFEGHAKYREVCRDAGRLADSLKALNGEFSPHDLYGRRPAGEDDRDDEGDE
jgi:hypothetical protein